MTSVREAGAILRGESKPARSTKYDTAGNVTPTLPDAREIRNQLKLS